MLNIASSEKEKVWNRHLTRQYTKMLFSMWLSGLKSLCDTDRSVLTTLLKVHSLYFAS